MVEISSQQDLLAISPKLYNDLSNNVLETLNDFKVSYSFTVSQPTSPIEKHILSLCSKKAAANLATQRGREYGFGGEASNRATAINKLDPSLLPHLHTDNLDCGIFQNLASLHKDWQLVQIENSFVKSYVMR